ncbi:glycosyltransferase family 8 protein [Wickerhamomyces anomalus NRRL Y-366-8]|uniref:Glycosyltransferase family 8 protein n=1 Tax=Wickerhamomyces anomalus (strain ATCC 58044 / CBS 1984 / NCYC 433 / NRRL Y-366-8) TaxID=683960 RepID=A0A1E3NU84_WICAA|nr:glycosyltransferase family 8 protein [Wickerhamomyces anomalus NRRL Y-366-8]ODQ56739.1 glycosyltransferase family 8 protein [Wickerhamomyces anomalus NRRL Y-366-8]
MTIIDSIIEDKRVWTTLITNTKYLTGLLALDYTLKKVGSKYPLVALYTDTLSEEGHNALDARDIPKLKIQYLLPVRNKDYSNDPRFYDCWSKLQPFSLYQFEKVVQLDSDMIVLQNMDELFDVELNDTDRAFAASHACVCNPYKYDHYPKDWIKKNCAFTDYYNKLENISDPVYGPIPSKNPLELCNGGLQVVKPSKVLYDKIVKALADKELDYAFADQSLLSDVFKSKWIGLSYIYNYLKTLRIIHDNLEFEKVKNIHYILTPKPWDISPIDRDNYKDDTDTFRYWWDVNDERLEAESQLGINDQF